nr:MAG TPA: hypothetical protein [Caudoviricetes sp.]
MPGAFREKEENGPVPPGGILRNRNGRSGRPCRRRPLQTCSAITRWCRLTMCA